MAMFGKKDLPTYYDIVDADGKVLGGPLASGKAMKEMVRLQKETGKNLRCVLAKSRDAFDPRDPIRKVLSMTKDATVGDVTSRLTGRDANANDAFRESIVPVSAVRPGDTMLFRAINMYLKVTNVKMVNGNVRISSSQGEWEFPTTAKAKIKIDGTVGDSIAELLDRVRGGIKERTGDGVYYGTGLNEGWYFETGGKAQGPFKNKADAQRAFVAEHEAGVRQTGKQFGQKIGGAESKRISGLLRGWRGDTVADVMHRLTGDSR